MKFDGMVMTINSCKYWLQRKNRYCKMRCKIDSEFCGEHDLDRVKCPLDPNHSVNPSLLEKHLTICNVAKKNLNIPDFIIDSYNLSESQIPINFSSDEIASFSLNIKRNNQEFKVENIEQTSLHSLSNDMNNSRIIGSLAPFTIENDCTREKRDGIDNKNLDNHQIQNRISLSEKHQIQYESISKFIIDNLRKDTIIIDLGAGKGGLCKYLIDRLFKSPSCDELKKKILKLVLIDRSNRRRKQFKLFANNGIDYIHLLYDIKDISFSKLIKEIISSSNSLSSPSNSNSNSDSNSDSIPSLNDSSYPHVIFIGKHLCGAATCLALRSIANLKRDIPFISTCMIIAPCCYHLCDPIIYPLKINNSNSFISNNNNETLHHDHINYTNWTSLLIHSSWYVCHSSKRPISTEQKALGKKARELIDFGRFFWITRHANFKMEIIEYVASFITPENKLYIIKH